MKPVKNDKRMEKGELTRGSILNAAIAIIAEGGLKEVSAAKLAAYVGVSKSTIFHHFKSSEEVLIGALNVVFDRFLQSLQIGEYRSVEHWLDSLGEAMFQVPASELTFVKTFLSFFHEGLFHPTYQHILASYAEQMKEIFHAQLIRLVPYSVPPQTIESVSMLILPMIDGIGFHFLLGKDSEKYRKIWKLQTKGILHLLSHSQ